MNLLEWLGIIFLSVVIVNLVVSIWAIVTALGNDEDKEVYYRH